MEKLTDDIDALLAQEVELERRLNELRQQRAALEKQSRPNGSKRGRPLRDLTMDMLQEAMCPLNSLLLASLIRPLFGRSVPATRFGTMSNDEAKSYDSSRARPVYLCHCLTYDQGQAVKRFWARSDWPLEERIMGPMSGRVLFLKSAAWTIELARRADAKTLQVDNPEVLKFLAADQARDAGLSVTRGDFPFEGWLGEIASAIERLAAEDRAIREAAATEIAARFQIRDQLFGSRAGLVSLPGSRDSWRSASGDNS